MTVQLSSLRVSAEMDASKYTAGAQQKVAADQAMTASSQGVGQAVTMSQQKISQSGDVLARLSRQYVDGYAAAQRMESALNQLSRGVDAGKIKMEQAGLIIDGIYRKYNMAADASLFLARGQNELAAAVTNANAKLAQQQQRIPAANQNRLSGNQLQGLSYQANDVVTMALLGAPASQIAFSQGGQILQNLQMGEGGIAGSLSAIKGSAAAAGTALVSTLGTVGLITTGFGLAAAAAGIFYLATREKAKDLKDATDAQRQAVMDLAKAYNDASLKAEDFYQKSIIASESAARRSNTDLQKSSDVANRSAISQLTTFITPGRSAGGYFGPTQQEFRPFNDAIQELNKEVRAGRPDYDAFEKAISGVVAQNPGLQTTADKILGIVEAATAAAERLGKTADYIKDINRASVGNFDRSAQAGRDQSVMSQRFGDDPFAAQREQQRQKEIALTEAQEERRRSLERTMDSARLDIDLIGQGTAAIEARRMAAQLEADVREQAARNNVAVDQAEIARIRQKAEEYGRLRALEEARTTIFNQGQDIELQRAELGLVGQNTLAHDRAIASLKAEQQIRKLGIDLYGEEANKIRANTAELSALAEASAKAKIQQDLLFDIRQAGRSAADQSVASQLRGAGLPEDLDSDVAKLIKMKDAIASMKQAWEDVFQTARDGIDGVVDALFDGGSIGDALKKAGRDLARTLFDQALTNPLKNWLTGSNLNTIADLGIFPGAASGKGGGFGGMLGNLLGAQKAVASMQVQAASVFINGAPIGSLGSLGGLLGGQSGSPFQANTTLTDLLTGGGAANQNSIQSRIDSAFGTMFSQDQIQSRISSAFGGSAGLGGIMSPAGGFASVLGSGSTGSMKAFQDAIKSVESLGSGGYSALGPLLKSGDQALGAYQIMQSNLPSWSKAALGQSISRSDFLSNPGAQDAIFNHQFGSYISKYGNSSDAASAWFTGGPLSRGAGKMDILGTTGSQYVDKFNAALGQATQNVGQLGGASTGALSNLVSSTGQAAGGLNALGSGAGKLGSMLGQFPAAPGGGGGGGLGGLFGSLFGGGGGLNSAFSGTSAFSFLSANPGGYIGLYADGTENAPPGWAVVGEKGPELRKLRGGDVIRSNARSMDMMKQAGGGGSNDNLAGLVRMLAPHLKNNTKIINVSDPSVVGDYLNTPAGEEVIMNVLRRNGR